MDIKKRYLRKPVTTVSWLIVLTAMALLLGIGANLLYSADSLLEIIDLHHSTIAVQTIDPGLTPEGHYQKLSATLSEREILALEALDPVKDVDMRMLTGAYIPELDARIALFSDGYDQNNYDRSHWDTYMNESYNEVILTGTVEQTWYQEGGSMMYNCSELGLEEPVDVRYEHAIVAIDEIVVAHSDYNFFQSEEYTGYSGKIHVGVPVYNTSEEPFFQTGEKYILCGTYDPNVRGDSDDGYPPELSGKFFPTLSLANTYAVPGETISSSDCLTEGDTLYYYPRVIIEWEWDAPRIRYPSENVLPAATRFDGTVEEFLETDALWADTVELFEKVLHTFPVLGTEALDSMYLFNRNEAVFIEGRSFTQEEYDTAAKVCVIEETLAVQAGLHVGDTITFSQFLCGKSAKEGNTSVLMAEDNGMLNNPGVGRFPLGSGLVTENEEFIVVGIYKLSRTWDTSAFSITPNTVFIPQKAQIEGGYGGATTFSSADGGKVNVNGCYGVYMSIMIENGRADEFLALAEEVVPNVFYTFDQGYEAAEESVRQVAVDARKLVGIAFIGWLLLLALYILLYQGKERQNLGIIRSVGGGSKVGRRYLFGSGFLLAAAGIFAGTLLSSSVTRLVSKQLAEFMFREGTMQTMSGGMELGAGTIADILSRASLPAATLLRLSAVQLAIIAALLWLHAYFTAKQSPRKLLGV